MVYIVFFETEKWKNSIEKLNASCVQTYARATKLGKSSFLGVLDNVGDFPLSINSTVITNTRPVPVDFRNLRICKLLYHISLREMLDQSYQSPIPIVRETFHFKSMDLENSRLTIDYDLFEASLLLFPGACAS